MALPSWLDAMASPSPALHPSGTAAAGTASQRQAARGRRAAAEASVLQLASRAAFLLVQQPGAVEGPAPAPLNPPEPYNSIRLWPHDAFITATEPL